MSENIIDLETLFDAGAHFGHQSKKWHPQMKEWIFTEKDGVHIFDLEKTAAQIQKAYDFAYELGKNKQTLIVVGTKKQARDVVEQLATDAGAMYIINRWMGGLVSNWSQVSRSLKRMLEIETGLTSDKYQDLTKYERLVLSKEQARLERFFGGLRELKNKPDAIFVIDVMHEKNAVKEALSANIPVIALIDSNSNPEGIAYPIPANDDAVSSIQLIVQAVLAGYKAGRTGGKVEIGTTEKSSSSDNQEAVSEVADSTQNQTQEVTKESGEVISKPAAKKKATSEQKTTSAKKTPQKTAAPKTVAKKETSAPKKVTTSKTTKKTVTSTKKSKEV